MRPKIFIIGFNKTATRSLDKFFKGNKLLTVHHDKNRLAKVLERNTMLGKKLLSSGTTRYGRKYEELIVFSDMTNAATLQESMHYYKGLDKDYPGSKFILNIRDTESWITSRFKHADGQLYRNHLEFLNLKDDEQGREILKQVYSKMHNDHHKDVFNYFKDRKHDLVVFDIHKDDINKIIEFLRDYYTLDPKYYKHIGKTKI